jgi:hypothetical protein
MSISTATSAILTLMRCRWWLRRTALGKERVLSFVKRLIMAHQGLRTRSNIKEAAATLVSFTAPKILWCPRFTEPGAGDHR